MFPSTSSLSQNRCLPREQSLSVYYRDNADFIDVTQDKKSPLHLASAKGQLEICRLLLGFHADASIADNVSLLDPQLPTQNRYLNPAFTSLTT